MAKAKIEILLSVSSCCMWRLGCLLMESQASQCLGHGWSPGKIYINQTQTDSVA